MAEKKGKERVAEYFGAKKAVVMTAALCLLYMLVQFVPENDKIAKTLPPMQPYFYVIIGIFVMILQILVWKRFALFHGGWYRDIVVSVLFLSEFVVMFFVISLLSWPFYFAGYLFFYLTKV
ncbi:MAG: hypothetical protein JW893_07190 [Candidatus Omnitrophica bacterium]|nr:hypothetical protein [Candidatus Omnitrophota bacterium]